MNILFYLYYLLHITSTKERKMLWFSEITNALMFSPCLFSLGNLSVIHTTMSFICISYLRLRIILWGRYFYFYLKIYRLKLCGAELIITKRINGRTGIKLTLRLKIWCYILFYCFCAPTIPEYMNACTQCQHIYSIV